MTPDADLHRSLAVEANNATWEFLGRPTEELGAADAEEMTRRAYAAAYHWDRADGATTANGARADWLLSRVWVMRSNGELARHHAERCFGACERGGLVDFDLAYAHEALARSAACLGDAAGAARHRALAEAVEIADPEDRGVVEADLASEPWFGC